MMKKNIDKRYINHLQNQIDELEKKLFDFSDDKNYNNNNKNINYDNNMYLNEDLNEYYENNKDDEE